MSSLVERVSGRRAAWAGLRLGWPGTVLHGVASALCGSLERARQRRALRGLNDHLLRDIGVTRAELEIGILRPRD